MARARDLEPGQHGRFVCGCRFQFKRVLSSSSLLIDIVDECTSKTWMHGTGEAAIPPGFPIMDEFEDIIMRSFRGDK